MSPTLSSSLVYSFHREKRHESSSPGTWQMNACNGKRELVGRESDEQVKVNRENAKEEHVGFEHFGKSLSYKYHNESYNKRKIVFCIIKHDSVRAEISWISLPVILFWLLSCSKKTRMYTVEILVVDGGSKQQWQNKLFQRKSRTNFSHVLPLSSKMQVDKPSSIGKLAQDNISTFYQTKLNERRGINEKRGKILVILS